MNTGTPSERANLDAPIPPDRLPWKVGQDKPDGFAYIISANGQIQGEVFTLPNAKLIVASVNHADKLAEACQMFLTALNKDQLNHAYAFTQKALAEWEKAQ